MYTTLVWGFIGMAMIWLDWPRPPLVLGMVLGKLAENNLFISYARYDLAFLTRPLLIVIMIVSVVIVFAPMVREHFARRAGMKGDLLVSEAG
jgi:TctA family transporter